jgi:PEP-CTERM motif
MKKISITLLVCSVAMAVQAQLGFYDSLNGTSLANYTWTPLNNAGSGSSGTTISFADSSGNGLEVDVANQAGTAVQGVYFNNTGAYLPIGDMLVASVDWQTTALEDFGICVGSSSSLTPANGDVDARSQTQYVFAALRSSNNHVTSSGYDGSAGGLGLLQYQGGGPAVVSLAIERATASTFNIYYDQGSGMTLLGTQSFTTSANVGDAIGFYTDVRANGTPAMGYLANLQVVESVPEPTTFAFFGLSGLLGLVARMRRKIA